MPVVATIVFLIYLFYLLLEFLWQMITEKKYSMPCVFISLIVLLYAYFEDGYAFFEKSHAFTTLTFISTMIIAYVSMYREYIKIYAEKTESNNCKILDAEKRTEKLLKDSQIEFIEKIKKVEDDSQKDIREMFGDFIPHAEMIRYLQLETQFSAEILFILRAKGEAKHTNHQFKCSSSGKSNLARSLRSEYADKTLHKKAENACRAVIALKVLREIEANAPHDAETQLIFREVQRQLNLAKGSIPNNDLNLFEGVMLSNNTPNLDKK